MLQTPEELVKLEIITLDPISFVFINGLDQGKIILFFVTGFRRYMIITDETYTKTYGVS